MPKTFEPITTNLNLESDPILRDAENWERYGAMKLREFMREEDEYDEDEDA